MFMQEESFGKAFLAESSSLKAQMRLQPFPTVFTENSKNIGEAGAFAQLNVVSGQRAFYFKYKVIIIFS